MRLVLAATAVAVMVVMFWGPGLDGQPSSDRPDSQGQPSVSDGGEGADPEAGPSSEQPDAESYELAWSLPSRQLVSAPVAAGGKVVVYAAHRGRLQLLVVDPETGEIVARRPSSSSYVTAGVTMAVAARGDLVYHYRPAGRLQLARVEVYDVRRDLVVSRSAPAYFWSLPTGCRRPDTGPICVAAGEASPASLYRVNAGSGRLRLAASDVGRGLGEGLYDAGDTISLVRADRRVWRRTAPAMFGGRPVTPAEGWDWQQQGGLLIGSFGNAEARRDGVMTKRPGHTARIDPRTGRPVWVRRGTAYCELDLMEPAADGSRRWFRCATSGTYDRSDWKTTITRFDPRTGAPLWTTEPARWDTVYDGSTWVKLSESLVAGRRGGTLVTLDVASGQVTTADPSAVGWCAQRRSYHDLDAAALPQTRIARGLSSPCRADGQPVERPAFVDPVFGVRVDGRFVWASTTGLYAVPSG
jgi:hypothetical protein